MTTHSPRLAYLVFLAWMALALPLVLAGTFATDPGEPSLALALHLAAVVTATLVGIAVSPRLRASIRALDPEILTSLQAWRVLGMMFLFLAALGDLPHVFAIPAGVGDVLVGLAAPIVLIHMRSKTLSRRAFGWFTGLGLFDFAVAFALGNYVNLTIPPQSGFASMAALPLVLVPGLFVPAFAVLHLAAWFSVQWRQNTAVAGSNVLRPSCSPPVASNVQEAQSN